MDWINSHHFIDAAVLFWIFNAIVNALPEPAGTSGWYRFLYTFLTTILGHLSDAIHSRQPKTASPTPPK
jgi:hypothetical protein